MVESQWAELHGKEIRYREQTWELTGTVDVRENGELLAVEATSAEDVKHQNATLYFGLESPGGSLNPGDLTDHFDRLERTKRKQYLIVRDDPKTYRYELERMEYD